MNNGNGLEWLLEQRSEVHQVQIQDHTFFLKSPTVAARDKFDARVAAMDLNDAQLRTPLLCATLCDQDGSLVGNVNFDELPVSLVEPLVDKARELFGLTDHPTHGGTD